MLKDTPAMVQSVRTIVPMNTFGMVKRAYQLYPKKMKVKRTLNKVKSRVRQK